MDICICDITELDCIRHLSVADPERLRTSTECSLTSNIGRIGITLSDYIRSLGARDGSMFIAVPDASSRRRKPGITCRIARGPFMPGDFIDLGQGVCGLSIELLFIQLCRRLPLIKRIRLACELAGRFSTIPNPRFNSPDGEEDSVYPTISVERPPLTTIERLRAVADERRGLPGAKLAREALRYAVDDACSPAETSMAIAMRLPHSKGGYACGPIVMNYRVDCNGHFRRLDSYLTIGGIDIEYGSRAHHRTIKDIKDDSKRANELSALGIPVVNVSCAEFRDPELFHIVMQRVYRLQGRRLRITTRDFEAKRAKLWRDLFS